MKVTWLDDEPRLAPCALPCALSSASPAGAYALMHGLLGGFYRSLSVCGCSPPLGGWSAQSDSAAASWP
jgi:hypothetical protein